MPFYKYISTPKWKALIEAEDFFYSHAIKIVDETVLRLKSAVESDTLTPGQFYFISYLLSRKELSLKDVTIICLSLFSDGLSTTTPTMLFNLYELARNPEAQTIIYDEIVSLAGKTGDLTADHINKMVYIKAFVKETFRRWPNGTEVSRYTDKPMVLSGYEIPAGTHVDLNPSVHFMDPRIFADPEAHKPERWIRQASDDASDKTALRQNTANANKDTYDENGVNVQIHPFLLTPFGHGTRMCAGRRYYFLTSSFVFAISKVPV